MRLLICDDHVVFAEALAVVLTKVGHTVVALTDSPHEALAVLRTKLVELCLLDVSFPTGSIFEVLPDLRAAAPEVKIILLTALSQPAVAMTAIAAGVDGFAHKGQRIDDLVRLIDHVHHGEEVRAGAMTGGVIGRHAELSDTERLARYLTPREREVLSHLVLGESAPALARAIGVSPTTARSHIQNVLTKLGVHSQLEAVTAAVRDGLVSVETGQWRTR
jgi:two-component system nitrate/nitrite response regulator NarL